MAKRVELRIVAYEQTEGGMNYHRYSHRSHFDLEDALAELLEAEATHAVPWYGNNGEWIIEGVWIDD